MVLASVLKSSLPVNRHGFFGLGGRADLLDLGPGSPSDGLNLAAPSWDASEGPRIEIFHGTTTLAFKFRHVVIGAADSQATAGAHTASQTVKKASTMWTVKETESPGLPSL